MVRKADCSNVIKLLNLDLLLELDDGQVIVKVTWKHQMYSIVHCHWQLSIFLSRPG